ncbi:MAG: hypothetical protein OEZ48_05770 [Candidatus Bathyarchaeota archaeon]|nr:hypothetical protein [Candidatus Bathyarchaeota archaeon]
MSATKPKLLFWLIILFLTLILWQFLLEAPNFQDVPAGNWDGELKGTNWVVTGWHLGNSTDYITEFADGEYHGLINDTRGDTIYSASCVQGFFPEQWQIPKQGGYYSATELVDKDRLRQEGLPHRLRVRFKIVNWTFNIDADTTYCGFTWVTVGIDIRGSVRGKDYSADAPVGDSWVFCANLFYVTNTTQGQIGYSRKDEILLRCRELHYGGGTENLYHYSAAMLDSEEIRINEWIEIDVDLRRYMQDFQRGFDPFWTAEKSHLIQPFVETCGGSIEAYFDYVKLS